MPRSPKLDDPAHRRTVLSRLIRGQTLTDAAAAVGMSRRGLLKYRSGNPEFDAKVEAAIVRGRANAESEPAMETAAEHYERQAEDRRRSPTSADRIMSAPAVSVPDLADVARSIVADSDSVDGPTVHEVYLTAWATATDKAENPMVRTMCWKIVKEFKLDPVIRQSIKAAEWESQRMLEAEEVTTGGGGYAIVSLPEKAETP